MIWKSEHSTWPVTEQRHNPLCQNRILTSILKYAMKRRYEHLGRLPVNKGYACYQYARNKDWHLAILEGKLAGKESHLKLRERIQTHQSALTPNLPSVAPVTTNHGNCGRRRYKTKEKVGGCPDF
jgi:hypothetical protein